MAKFKHAPAIRIIFFDLLLLNLINLFFVFVIKKYSFRTSPGGENYTLLLILFNLLWVLLNTLITQYSMEINKGILQEIKKIIINITLFTGVISIFAFFFKSFMYSRLIIFGSIVTFFIFLIPSHFLLWKFLKWINKKNPQKSKILIVGHDPGTFELSNAISANPDIQYDIMIYIGSNILEKKVDEKLMVGHLSKIKDLFENNNFDEMFILVSTFSVEEIQELIEIADFYGTRIRIIPEFFKLVEHNFKINLIENIPIIHINEIPLDKYYNSLYKRIFDLAFSILALLLLSPFMLIIGILVKITSKGPLLYVAERVGRKGEIFNLYKFRTMYHSDENIEELSTSKNDSRVTTLGRFLRKYNLDELPQFYNVLRGDMSVVGPRPHRVYLDKKLQDQLNKYMTRHYVKPGITGWAQVNGWRGPTDTTEQKNQRLAHDLWYLNNWTFWIDIKIIFFTLFGKKVHKNAF